jgi:hypothetical protein
VVITNDIGTIDAHVLIVEVEGSTTTLRYTDVHRKRARFFQSLFQALDVRWENMLIRRDEALAEGFVLVTYPSNKMLPQEQLRALTRSCLTSI